MKITKNNKKIAYVVLLILVLVAACASMIQPRTLGIPIIVSAALIATLCVSLLTFAGIQQLRHRDPKGDNYDRGPVAKILSALLVTALATCVFTAIKSFWLEPSYAKFAYENTASIAGFGAVLLLFILSALQRDIYWVTRKKTLALDERQVKERQQVFETSYKLGAFITLGAAWFAAGTLHNIPAIIAMNSHSMPGHLLWLPYSLALTLFALPLIVAAWRK
jgi:hypothetical protein